MRVSDNRAETASDKGIESVERATERQNSIPGEAQSSSIDASAAAAGVWWAPSDRQEAEASRLLGSRSRSKRWRLLRTFSKSGRLVTTLLKPARAASA